MADEWIYRDNGFSNLQEMQLLHQPLIESVIQITGQQNGSIIDFGCGNGALLKSICSQTKLTPFGIDTKERSSCTCKIFTSKLRPKLCYWKYVRFEQMGKSI